MIMSRLLIYARCPGPVDFLEHLGQWHSYIPIGIVRTALRQIADVANVVALTVLVHLLIILLLAAHGSSHLERLQNAHTVGVAATEIVGLATPWCFPELLNEPGDVARVNIVANLLTLVAEDPIE